MAVGGVHAGVRVAGVPDTVHLDILHLGPGNTNILYVFLVVFVSVTLQLCEVIQLKLKIHAPTHRTEDKYC